VLKNIGSNWALNGLQLLVFLVLARFIVLELGLGPRGVWGALIAALGPLQLLVLGVPMATVRFVSGHVAKGELETANRVLATCTAVMVLMGVTAIGLSGAGYFGFDALLANPEWALEPAARHDARVAYALMALQVATGFVLTLPYAVFAAYQDFVVRNLVMAGGLLLRLVLTIALLRASATLTMLATVQLIVAAAEFVGAALLSRRRHRGVSLSLRGLDLSLLKPIFSFSVFAMLLNIGALLAFRLDALVIGAFMDQVAVGIYEYGNLVFEPFLNIVLAIGMVVMPMATTLEAQGRAAELVPILRKWTKVASCIVFLVGLWLIVVGPAFLAWYLEHEYHSEMGTVLQVLAVSFLAFLPVRGVALPLLMGMGRQVRPALALLVMGVMNLGLSIALVRDHGLFGVALGTAIPNILFAVYVFRVAAGSIGGSTLALAWGAFFQPLFGAGIAAGALAALDHFHPIAGFFPLLVSGLFYVALFGVIQVLYVWRRDPDFDFAARLRARFSR